MKTICGTAPNVGSRLTDPPAPKTTLSQSILKVQALCAQNVIQFVQQEMP